MDRQLEVQIYFEEVVKMKKYYKDYRGDMVPSDRGVWVDHIDIVRVKERLIDLFSGVELSPSVQDRFDSIIEEME